MIWYLVLPKSIGKLCTLQKLMLSGNRLSQLPSEMQNCTQLELIRLSENQFAKLPEWLFDLPRLSWLAFAGNPLVTEVIDSSIVEHLKTREKELPEVPWSDIEFQELVGEGASGYVYRALRKNLENCDSTVFDTMNVGQKDLAVKLFKGAVTSDGVPEQEMKVIYRVLHNIHILVT